MGDRYEQDAKDEARASSAAKPPLGECPLTASHTRRACDNGGSCWCIEHPEEVAAINAQDRESLVERRVFALYILLGVAAGFALATMLWGLSEVMPT